MSYMRDINGVRLDTIAVATEDDVATRVPLAEKGAALGVATLDGGGKIPANQLPSSVMEYKGVWNAATNVPVLVDGTGDPGDTYRVSVAGTRNLGSGPIVFEVGDLVLYDGSIWQRSDATDAVTSVADLVGTITAAALKAGLSLPADTISELAAEALARATQDTILAGLISTEVTNRTNAVSGEATTRANADIALGSRIDQIRPIGTGVIGQIGASISSNGALSYYDRALSGAVSYGNLAIMSGAIARTKGKFTAGGVAATNGFTTTQMIATWLPVVLTSNWDYCIVGEVTNDLGNAFAIADTKANILTIVAALVAAGIKPVLTTMPPQDVNASGAGLTWITQYNEWVKNLARVQGFPIVDYHTVLVNPATNTYAAGYSADGIHPNATGVRQMSIKLAEVLNSIPGPVRSPVEGAYNPNLLIPDLAANSAGSDKFTVSGNTGGGWCYGLMTSTRWRGNAPVFVRGSVGDYSLSYPVTAGAMIAGNRVRLGFNINGFIPANAAVSAYLYNNTQLQVVAGLSALAFADGINDGTTVVATDAAVTSGSNLITCATSKPFRPDMKGNDVAVLSSVSTRFPAGTTLIGFGPDGATAYASANANATVSAQTVIVLGVPQAASFEFDVQPDMVGDTFNFIVNVTGAAGAMISPSQVTLADLTALGAA